jgi:hypothetical protein
MMNTWHKQHLKLLISLSCLTAAVIAAVVSGGTP